VRCDLQTVNIHSQELNIDTKDFALCYIFQLIASENAFFHYEV